MAARRWFARVLVFATGLFLAAAAPLPAHDEHEHESVPKVADEVAHRPTAIPDRIILTWTGDPATTQAVTWRTDTSVPRGLAEIAEATDGPEFANGARRVRAGEPDLLASDLNRAHYHTAEFTGLRPRTKYAYRVGDGTNWSEWNHFTTAGADPEPFTFIYFGDAQNDVKSMWSRVIREAYTDAPKAAFMLHAGDLINRSDRDAEWGEWFDAGGWANCVMPSIATPGNHEYARDYARDQRLGRRLSHHWRPAFAFPENGPDGLEETVYSIDYQGTRIVSLNSNEKQEEQVAWLEKTLSENPNRWTVITFHHPIYSAAKGRDNASLRDLWQPVFDKHRVDLVLQGHDHTYARTGLMIHENVPTGATARSEEGGTMYVVSVSGPKMYNVDREPFMKRVAENTQLYQVITIDRDELRYEARTATGRLYDAFTLRKRAGKTNELIDQIPDTPERLEQ